MIPLATMPIKFGIGNKLEGKSDIFLATILLVMAGVIIFVAFVPGHHIFKALFIAWIVMP
jgi:hypothetical protein